jgi:CheY-like chemotaxis protein
VTKRLVTLHGGSISVTSPGPGKGSTFTCRFPIEEPGELLPFSAEITAPSATTSKSLSILIVDDNYAAAESLQKLLAYRGYRARRAHSGTEALNMMQQSPSDVVFLDIGLPDMSGYQVAEELRKRGVSAKIVALTGYGQEEDRLRSREVGCNHHLVKPVGLKEIEPLLS